MHTNRLLALFTIFCCLIILVSCRQTANNTSSDPINTPSIQLDAATHPHASGFEFTPNNDHMSDRLPDIANGISPIRPMDGALYLVDRSMVYRYSIETGGVIPLCNDPLCMHNSTDCPFYGLNTVLRMIHASNNNIFYAQDYMQWNAALGKFTYIKRLMRYDLTNNRPHLVENIPTGVQLIDYFFYKDYQYYLNLAFDEVETDDGKTTSQMRYEICERNLITLQTRVLRDFGDIWVSIASADDERLYYVDALGNLGYILLKDPTQGKVVCFRDNLRNMVLDGDYFYGKRELGKNENNRYIYELYRISKEGGDAQVLTTDDVQYHVLTDRYIYYSRTRVKFPYYDDSTILVLPREIYRIPKEGGEPECVYTIPDDMDNIYFRAYVVDGNYLYAAYIGVDRESGEQQFGSYTSAGPDYMRVNLLTGEITYITY